MNMFRKTICMRYASRSKSAEHGVICSDSGDHPFGGDGLSKSCVIYHDNIPDIMYNSSTSRTDIFPLTSMSNEKRNDREVSSFVDQSTSAISDNKR